MSASAEKIVDIRRVAEANPAVDLGAIEEVQHMLQELRRGGMRSRGYEISSPYVRKPMRRILRPGTDASG